MVILVDSTIADYSTVFKFFIDSAPATACFDQSLIAPPLLPHQPQKEESMKNKYVLK